MESQTMQDEHKFARVGNHLFDHVLHVSASSTKATAEERVHVNMGAEDQQFLVPALSGSPLGLSAQSV